MYVLWLNRSALPVALATVLNTGFPSASNVRERSCSGTGLPHCTFASTLTAPRMLGEGCGSVTYSMTQPTGETAGCAGISAAARGATVVAAAVPALTSAVPSVRVRVAVKVRRRCVVKPRRGIVLPGSCAEQDRSERSAARLAGVAYASGRFAP